MNTYEYQIIQYKLHAKVFLYIYDTKNWIVKMPLS
jgi:hypothetical protein